MKINIKYYLIKNFDIKCCFQLIESNKITQHTMSDDNSTAVEDQKKKRGRPSKGEKSVSKEPKKRGRPAAEKNNTVRSKSDNEDDAPSAPAKRGRGRPKGSHKKKVYPSFAKFHFLIFFQF